MHQRLTALCEHLGVTVNAYMTGEIGKAVSRDEMAFKVQENQNSMFAALAELMESEKGDEKDA
jgi:hypothetical protein